MNQSELAPPARSSLLRESRALVDLATMPLKLFGPRGPSVAAEPVIVLPGFGAGERSMRPLRSFLSRHGLSAEDWGLGVNRAGLDRPHGLADLSPSWHPAPLPTYRGEGGVANLVDLMVERVQTRFEQLQRPIALVGWSLGGTIAREVARDAPHAVSQVITLGSPMIGGPKYTAAAAALRRRGLDIDWIEEQVMQRESRPVTVPITAIVSPTDGIVGYAAARDHYSERVEHIELDVSHVGMGFNSRVWDVVLAQLAKPHDH